MGPRSLSTLPERKLIKNEEIIRVRTWNNSTDTFF